MKVFQGQRPDLTPAQVVAAMVAGVPVIATLLHAFGVFDMTGEQQDALKEAVQWAGLFALGLFGADAGLRAARNHATAKVTSVAVAKDAEPNAMPATPSSKDDLSGATAVTDSDLPSDEQEFNWAPAQQEHDDEEDDFEPDWDEDEYHPDADPGPESRLQPAVPAEDDR